jgi:hypothetical protein
VVEPFRHHRDDRREPALDFVGHSQGEHEVLAGGVHIFRRRQDGAEIVARMSETARRHITVEEIDIARQAGVKERRLIQRGLAPPISVQRPGARYSSNWSRNAANGRPGKAKIAQARLSRMLRLNSWRISGVKRSGRAATAKAAMRSTVGPCFLPLLARHRTLRCVGHAVGLQFYTHDTPQSVC